MRIYFDTEFIERGREHPLTLISLGAVREDGATFYNVSSEFREEDCNDWVKANVLPHLAAKSRTPVESIAARFQAFAGASPEFWADYGAYDWVVLCQMYGSMMDLPAGWPMFVRDAQMFGVKVPDPATPHNALSDAISLRDAMRSHPHR